MSELASPPDALRNAIVRAFSPRLGAAPRRQRSRALRRRCILPDLAPRLTLRFSLRSRGAVEDRDVRGGQRGCVRAAVRSGAPESETQGGRTRPVTSARLSRCSRAHAQAACLRGREPQVRLLEARQRVPRVLQGPGKSPAESPLRCNSHAVPLAGGRKELCCARQRGNVGCRQAGPGPDAGAARSAFKRRCRGPSSSCCTCACCARRSAQRAHLAGCAGHRGAEASSRAAQSRCNSR